MADLSKVKHIAVKELLEIFTLPGGNWKQRALKLTGMNLLKISRAES